MHLSKALPLIILVIFISPCFAQKENKNWYFGSGTDGIVFDASNNPVKVSNKYPGLGYEGSVTVSDPFSGDLLFYTDGINVINKNHALMTNGSGLLAHYSGSQCVQACRVPNTCDQYYVISNSSFDNVAGSYYYSIVDFSNNSLGVVTIKNQLINGPNYHQAMCMVPKSNSNNYWLIGHLYQTATYHVFEVTPGGFIGPTVYNFSNSGRSWAMKFNKTTNKLLVLGEDDIDVTLMDFNPATGVLSNELQLSQSPIQDAWVGNFSPDGSKIYVGVTPGYVLWQYDLSNSTWTNMNTCCYAHDVLTGPNGITYFIHSYNATNPLAQMLDANLSAIGNACGYSTITNPGNFNGEVRRFPEFLTAVPPPDADTDTLTITNGGSVQILPLTNDSDPQGDPINLDSILSGPQFGSIQVNGNQVVYFPDTCKTYVDSILYKISDSNCSFDTAYIIINVFAITPVALFTYTIDTCLFTVSFTNNSSYSNSYLWDFGDGTTGITSNPIHQFPSAGTYDVTLIASAGFCIDTLTIQISIPVIPVVSAFTAQIDSCDLTVQFQNNSQNASGFSWDFGDTGFSQLINPVHQYTGPGNFTITLIATGICGADTSQLTLYLPSIPDPIAQFIVQVDTCTKTISLINQSQNASTYQWNFGDGFNSALQNPIHQYAAPGTYQIVLNAFNNCTSDSIASQLTIINVPPAISAFTYQVDTCNPTVSFINGSSNNLSQIWYFGDGLSSNLDSPIHNYSTPGVYQVMLVAFDSCTTDTLLQTIDVTPLPDPQASFTYSIYNCGILSVAFTNTSQNATSYFWDFGEGTSDTTDSPVHIFQTTGAFQVQLIAGNTCASDTTQAEIIIDSVNVVSSFFYNVDSCTNTIYFINASQNAQNFLWTFGDGSSSNEMNPVHNYNFNGSFNIVLIANSGVCSDTSDLILSLDELNDSPLFIPNCFTPNGDGKNDEFQVLVNGNCSDFSVNIFNRWGNLIFEGDSESAWDGTSNNTKCPEGVYCYILKGSFGHRSGIVHLLR